jgi:UDP:flavonoid glycosyltransferase YjiC (YdhE family)
MRLLLTFAGGAGHLEPLVPIARAAEAAGHVVAFSGRPAVAARVAELGFEMHVTGPPGPQAPAARTPLLEVDLEREAAVLRNGFAGRIARERADGVLAICEHWRPDIVVCGEVDFGAMRAAHHARLPFATLLISATEEFVPDELASDVPARLVLSPFPPSLRPLPANAHAFRTATARRPPADATTVYVTLGTIFNLESGDLFERVLAGVRDLPVDVVATTGSNLDPADLGTQPPNVRIERFLPQSDVLPRCAAIVSHAGSGSVLAALAHGLPSVLLPMGADQPQNATRCGELGVARVLDAVRASPEAIRVAVADILHEPSYRAAARRIAAEIAALPGPEHAVGLLEPLAA